MIRSVDPLHRAIGESFRDEVAEPLGVEFYIGVPPEVLEARISRIAAFHPSQVPPHLNTMLPGMALSLMNPRRLSSRSLNDMKLRPPGGLNKPEWRSRSQRASSSW